MPSHSRRLAGHSRRFLLPTSQQRPAFVSALFVRKTRPKISPISFAAHLRKAGSGSGTPVKISVAASPAGDARADDGDQAARESIAACDATGSYIPGSRAPRAFPPPNPPQPPIISFSFPSHLSFSPFTNAATHASQNLKKKKKCCKITAIS